MKSFQKMGSAAAYLLAVAMYADCQSGVITGQVKDGFGRPLEGASASIAGTTFSTLTDGEGNYSLECVPGSVTVEIKKGGYSAVSFFVNLPVATRYPAWPVTIFRLPPSASIWLVGRSDYKEMPTAKLSVNRSRVPLDARSDRIMVIQDRYIISVKNAPTFEEGHLMFLDNTGNNTRLLRLSFSGEAMVRTYRLGEVHDSLTITQDAVSTEGSLVIREMNLKPGLYAFVNIDPGPDAQHPRYTIVDPVFPFRVEK